MGFLDVNGVRSGVLDTATTALVNNPASAQRKALDATYSGVSHRARHEYGGADAVALDARQIVEPVRDWVRNKLAATPTATFRVVFMGDSQTNDGSLQQPAGQTEIWGGGKGYSYRLANLLTKGGVQSAQTGVTGVTTNTTPGAHVWSTAVAGATSGSYAPAATITNITTIQPELVFHMIGTNDFANQVTPATYKANVLKAMQDVWAGTTNARQVLIVCWPRINPATVTYPWSAYATALREIADQYKTDPRFALFDYGMKFERAGGASLSSWMGLFPDGIHGLPELHRELAEELAAWLGLPSPLAAFGTARVLRGTVVANGVVTAASPASTLDIPAAPVPRTVTVKVRATATVTAEGDIFVRTKDETNATTDYPFHVQTATLRSYPFEVQAEIPAHSSRTITLYGSAGVNFFGGAGNSMYNQFWAEVSYI